MTTIAELGDIPAKVEALRLKFRQRDQRAMDVQAVRRGDFESVAPDLFNDGWPRPIVANTIDTSARDMAAVIAPLPTFNCSASTLLTDKAKKFADKRTKIVNNYISSSDLEEQMLVGADQYNTYGMITFSVQPNALMKLPYIRVEDSFNTYPVWDRYGRTIIVARVMHRDAMSIAAEFPELANAIEDHRGHLNGDRIELIQYVDDDRVVIYAPALRNAVLVNTPNPLGRCFFVCRRKPGLDAEVRGTYDDVIWVQLARHRFQMLAMEAADKAVRAPLVVPHDAGNIPIGPDAVIHTQQGAQSVGRARLDVPNAAFASIDQLKQELREGSMAPESRSGSIDASNITGRGIQELNAGWSSQINAAQIVFKRALAECVHLCFAIDEKFWPRLKKTVRGQEAGIPYEITYSPTVDINGDHTVDIQYGMYAGLDPNRALVLTLQAQAAGLVSRDFARRQLPAGINAAEEEKRIEIEAMRDSLLQAMSALSQGVPAMMAQGQDVSELLGKVAAVTKALQDNDSIEDIMVKVFAPAPPPPAPDPMALAGAPGDPAAGGAPEGFQDGGTPVGLTPGMATEGPNARPDMQQFFAGMTAGGNPNLGSVVSRMAPTR